MASIAVWRELRNFLEEEACRQWGSWSDECLRKAMVAQRRRGQHRANRAEAMALVCGGLGTGPQGWSRGLGIERKGW